ncbi:MAG: response regulator [Magnetococcales bacterium]|nr:response regulator [Magnetococcales bacterium]
MRILIVDDEQNNRDLLQYMLKSIGSCDMAEDGSEAVEAFLLALEGRDPYHLILLDIMMPGMDGQNALKSIRAHERERGVAGTDEVVVFMVTALDTEQQVVEAFFKGCCTEYLTKPVKQKVLFDKLREYHLMED